MKADHKKPTARVMFGPPWIDSHSAITVEKMLVDDVAHAAIPLPATRAKRLVTFANMTDEEKVMSVAEELPFVCRGWDDRDDNMPDLSTARTILQSIGLIGGGK